MRKALLVAAVAIGAVTQVYGQSTAGATIPDTELVRCTGLTTDGLRLHCFDQATRKLKSANAPSATKPTTGQKGKWSTSTDKDPLTDKPVLYATLEADEGKGKYGGAIGMIVRCKNNKTEAYINWNSFLGTDSINVTNRVDKDPASKAEWSISTDHRASFIRNPIPLLKRLESSNIRTW